MDSAETEAMSREVMEAAEYEPLPDLRDVVQGLTRERYEEWKAARRAFMETIATVPLGPRVWPRRGDAVRPTPEAIERLNRPGRHRRYKGTVYVVRLCRVESGWLSVCPVCHSPIEEGSLYAARNGCAGLCLDCVELA